MKSGRSLHHALRLPSHRSSHRALSLQVPATLSRRHVRLNWGLNGRRCESSQSHQPFRARERLGQLLETCIRGSGVDPRARSVRAPHTRGPCPLACPLAGLQAYVGEVDVRWTRRARASTSLRDSDGKRWVWNRWVVNHIILDEGCSGTVSVDGGWVRILDNPRRCVGPPSDATTTPPLHVAH